MEEYVYFLTTRRGYVKVGYTSRPVAARLYEHRAPYTNSCFGKPRCIGYIVGDKEKEREFIRLFSVISRRCSRIAAPGRRQPSTLTEWFEYNHLVRAVLASLQLRKL